MSTWFKGKFYFLFWMLLALVPMKFVCDESQEISTRSTKSLQGYEEQASKVKVTPEELYSYAEQEDSELSKISDNDLLDMIEIPDESWTLPAEANDPYMLSPEQLDQYEQQLMEGSGLVSTAGDIDFTTIAGDEAAVNYEDTKACAKSRLNIENIISTTKLLKESLTERTKESDLLPRKCVVHVMNKFSIGSKYLSRCPNPKGQPVRGGAKPCISKNLANLTYNSFVDVAECFNIDPKQLLPKLSNESGMLINVLGGGFDAGVGQLTLPAIQETNKYYDKYFAEAQKAAIKKPSCLRVMQLKPYLGKAKDSLAFRCSLIAPPENPIKNIMYMAIYNRLNLDALLGTKYIAGESFIEKSGQMIPLTKTTTDNFTDGRFADNEIKEKFNKLGLTGVNLNSVATMIAFAGYNAGPSTAFNMLNEYLDRRISAKPALTLKEQDFDFHNPGLAKDIDGKEKPVTDIARLFIRATAIKKGDPEAKAKLKRVKLLPEKIRKSYLLTFPEFIIYNQNNFDRSILNPSNAAKVAAIKNPAAKTAERRKYPSFATVGAPGYLTFLASKDKAIRQAFENSGADPMYCSNPKFLKVK